MAVTTLDDDGRVSFGFRDVLDRATPEAKAKLALYLACDTDVYLHVAKLLVDGITFDDQDRFWYPPTDDVQEGRLYLLEHFDQATRSAIEQANSERDGRKREASDYSARYNNLLGYIEERWGSGARSDAHNSAWNIP